MDFHRVVTSSDGEKVKVGTVLDMGHKDVPKGIMRQIARQIHVDPTALDDVLKNWDATQYLAHCATLPASQLMPPSISHGAPGALPPAPRRATPAEDPTELPNA